VTGSDLCGGSARRPHRRVAVVAAVLALLTSLAGCAAGGRDAGPPRQGAPAETPAPLADCEALSAPPVDPPPADAVPSPPDDAAPPPATLPEVTLPCFTGGEPVALDELRGPALINLWASWCLPCREELPVLQDFADSTAGRVHVVGVVTEDSRAAAAWFADAAGVSFPGLYDRNGQVRAALPGMSLPVTLFVDGDRTVRYLHHGAMDAAELDRLAAEHLGVTR
jgi:thiol-disulfide isomerase/thioredoxin